MRWRLCVSTLLMPLLLTSILFLLLVYGASVIRGMTDYGQLSLRVYTEPYELPVLYSSVFPRRTDHNIFMLDTSGSHTLNRRTLCSLESYLKFNEGLTVWLLVTAHELSVATMSDLRDLTEVYPHLRVAALDLHITLVPTPLANIMDSKDLERSKYRINNLSNLARMAIVFRSGGFYSDTDVIALRSVRELRNNIGLQTKSLVNTAAFHFEANHPYLGNIMLHISQNFKGSWWGANGPEAATATLRKYCPQFKDFIDKNLYELYKKHAAPPQVLHLSACHVSLLPTDAFYPVHWSKWKLLFEKDSHKIDMNEIRSHSYGLHLSNHLSQNSTAVSGSIIASLCETVCPVTLKRYGTVY